MDHLPGNHPHSHRTITLFSIPVLVAAMGYFVDIYDLLLFSIIRVKSLKNLGLSEALIDTDGKSIISYQMYGLLIGGIIWGILGDKKGRLKVLFGSIILYSLANIANGFVTDVTQYGICRFIAGIGLAGELGAGITLVSELIPKEKRGLATSVVAGIGLSGAVLAYFVKESFENWRICYFIGGGLGFLLLLLRIHVFESGMFNSTKEGNVVRGNIFMLIFNRKRGKKYLLSILIGLPTWYVIGILITFSTEFGKRFGIKEPIDAGKAVMLSYIAIVIGDLLIGFVSQWLKSRKKALYIFYGFTIIALILYFNQYNGTANGMYAICMFLGFGTGFWAIFVTMAAEHFGTNLRATAATTVPNIVRGSLPLTLFMFKQLQGNFSYINAAAITGVVIMIISSIAVLLTDETFGRDLHFVETDEKDADIDVPQSDPSTSVA